VLTTGVAGRLSETAGESVDLPAVSPCLPVARRVRPVGVSRLKVGVLTGAALARWFAPGRFVLGLALEAEGLQFGGVFAELRADLVFDAEDDVVEAPGFGHDFVARGGGRRLRLHGRLLLGGERVVRRRDGGERKSGVVRRVAANGLQGGEGVFVGAKL